MESMEFEAKIGSNDRDSKSDSNCSKERESSFRKDKILGVIVGMGKLKVT